MDPPVYLKIYRHVTIDMIHKFLVEAGGRKRKFAHEKTSCSNHSFRKFQIALKLKLKRKFSQHENRRYLNSLQL